MAPGLGQEPSFAEHERQSLTTNTFGTIPTLQQQNDNVTSGSGSSTAATQKAAGGGTRRRTRRHRDRRNKKIKHPNDREDVDNNNNNNKGEISRRKEGEGPVVRMAEETISSVQSEHPGNPHLPGESNIPITTATILNQSKESPKDIREWFNTLSIEERVAALAFEDKVLLSVVSKVLVSSAAHSGRPPSSQQIPVDKIGDRATDRPKEGKIDWQINVTSNDFEMALTGQNSDDDDSNVLKPDVVSSLVAPDAEEEIPQSPINISTDAPNQDNDVLNCDDVDNANAKSTEKMLDDNNDNDDIKDKDDIRIRVGAQGGDVDISETAETVSTTMTDEDTTRDNKNTMREDESPRLDRGVAHQNPVPDHTDTIEQIPTKLLELFDNLCLIVPEAFQLSTDKAMPSTSLPFITFHPTYLRKIDDDILSILDETNINNNHIITSSSFFAFPSHASWIDAVRDVYKAIDMEGSKGIPLYLMLITRFHFSLFDAYKTVTTNPAANQQSIAPAADATKNDEGSQVESDPGPSNHVQKINETIPGSDPVSVAGICADEQTNAATADKGPTEESLNAAVEVISLSSLVPKVIELMGRAVASSDTSELLDIFRRHAPDMDDLIHSFEDMFLLPLPMLMHKVAASSVGFERIIEVAGSGVTEALKALESQQQQQQQQQQQPVAAASQQTEPDGASTLEDKKGNVEKDGASQETSQEAPVSSVDASVQVNSSVTQVVQENVPGRKKKKKKKKKKKGSTGNQPSNTKEVGNQGKSNVTTSEVVDERKLNGRSQNEDKTPVKADEAAQNRASGRQTRTPPSPPMKENVDEPKASNNEDATVADVDAGKSKEESSIPAANDKKTGISADAPERTETSNENQVQRNGETGTTPDEGQHEDDHSAWETVEVRSRNNRKKANDRNTQGRFGSQHGNNGSGQQHGSKKTKLKRTSEGRKKSANRKMVREILAGVLDTVDDEVRKRRQTTRDEGLRFSASKWPSASSNRNQIKGHSGAQKTNEEAMKSGSPATMRDVLVGRQPNSVPKGSHSGTSTAAKRSTVDRSRGKPNAGKFAFDNNRRNRDNNHRASQLLGGKPNGTPTADQNTAATVPETVSANSALLEPAAPRTAPPRGTVVTRSDCSSGESAEETKEKHKTKETGKEASPSPPLPTLLSPGNNNSASSSVASSLEAPHAVHNVNHHSSFLGGENDVGYHLLRVCDRLTRDIQIFMKRREYALEVRRKERGMVLEALQESLSTIWPEMCSVEMYGSCATELDLPSSDLDIVVCGLDRPMESVRNSRSGSVDSTMSSDKKPESKKSDFQSADSVPVPSDGRQHTKSGRIPSHQSQAPLMYGHLSVNADRVVRLAMELEMQPWAVHVKAIPTASVPVIKILADPTRLTGAARAETGEWLVQQSAGGQSNTVDSSGSQSPPPWRGADVVNGLMKVDITFEGPEHGGIGSTKFSSRVVQEFCKETNLSADQTPAVQVLMVLKELLAQRRLNEPFSGGLSSYALLLLVISVVRERAIIKEELERVERQRRIVAAGGGNSTLRINNTEFVPHGSQETNQSPSPIHGTKNTGDGSRSQKTEELSTTKPMSKSEVEDFSQAARSIPKEPTKSSAAASTSNPANMPQQKPATAAKATREELQKRQAPNATVKKSMGAAAKPSSWASIAKKSASGSGDRSKTNQDAANDNGPEKQGPPQQVKPKVSSFADAVAKGAQTAASNSSAPAGKQAKKTAPDEKKNRSSKKAESKPTDPETPKAPKTSTESRSHGPAERTPPTSVAKQQPSSSTSNSVQAASSPQRHSVSPTHSRSNNNNDAGAITGQGSLFPQGFHDVTEVLCSGETTPGKLLMNFLLFYGQHFDSQSTAIDYSSTHKREGNNNGYSHTSPYLQRQSAGSYDPVTGMLTVDPIVVYDPLEGAENSNVARSCFAWSSIRWVFSQSYMTLSSVVEMSASNTTSGQNGVSNGSTTPPAKDAVGNPIAVAGGAETWSGPYIHDDSGHVIVDPSSSLLELLLAF